MGGHMSTHKIRRHQLTQRDMVIKRLQVELDVLRTELKINTGPENDLHMCAVCYEDGLEDWKGLSCRPMTSRVSKGACDHNEEEMSVHFICLRCLCQLVKTCTTNGYVGRCYTSDCKLLCPVSTCTSPPYDVAWLAYFLPNDVFQLYIDGIVKHREKHLVVEIETGLQRKLKAIESESVVERHVRHISEEIINLKCPNPTCHMVFVDFDGCFALTCSRCKIGFCAFCLKDFGVDAHAHVPNCELNPKAGSMFGNFRLFEVSQRKRRQLCLSEYLATIANADVRAEVIRSLSPQLKNLKINIVK
eukprot:CFRG8328T1